jgi:glycosyltransferase involved in cell wall biosynthesis
MNDKIRVAQIRGDGLSDRETKTWEYFPEDIDQTIFAPRRNNFSISKLPFPITTLKASSDNFLTKNLYKYFFGQYRRMFGLEERLKDFDIAHAGELFNFYTYQCVRAKKIHKKLKVVATVWENTFGRFEYNYWPGFKIPPRYWRDQINKVIDANVQGVDMFLPATQDAAELLKDYGVPKERITVVRPGIIPAPEGGKGIPEFAGKEIYLVVSRLVKEKGVYDILYAWRLYLRSSGPAENKLLLFVGAGPEVRNMKRLVKEWGMQSKVAFVPGVQYSEILGVYKSAKCLMLASVPMPTWQEQFGYVLAEAICAGTPLIGTFCGAIPEIVGKAGVLASPSHPIDFAKAIKKMDDPAVYARLKEGCLEEREKYNVNSYTKNVAEIYRKLSSI